MQTHQYTPSARTKAEGEPDRPRKNGNGNTANAAIDATSQTGPLWRASPMMPSTYGTGGSGSRWVHVQPANAAITSAATHAAGARCLLAMSKVNTAAANAVA